MLKEVTGNLIDMGMNGDFDVIIHGANCYCTMGGGIAREIRVRIPEVYEADCQTVSGDRSKLGLFTYATVTLNPTGDDTTSHELTVISAYTQYGMARRGEDVFEYEAFDDALNLINRKFPGARIGIPLIGCGLAGGDEKRIRAIMENHAKRMDLTLVVFQP
jgi:O-acetyl-ADP-ribose deacetylase (regulator of RNase III)